MKPYVVSQDVSLLIERWANPRGFVLPSQDFFRQLRRGFSDCMRKILPALELVSEQEMSDGIATLVARCSLPIVSLDPVYHANQLHLDFARLVGRNRGDCGLGSRSGKPSLEQVESLRAIGVQEVALADDVIFSGAGLEQVVNLLSGFGIQVPRIVAGIGVGEGLSRLRSKGIEISCVRTYEEVIDQVCERDFYPGVLLSGRTLVGADNVGVPYVLPFGKPGSWASIPPEQERNFSREALCRTVELFSEISHCSCKSVLCSDLERKVIDVAIGNKPFVCALQEILKAL